jgi:hypothetical protein
MKNIKVTYKYINPSKILNNLLFAKPREIDTISVFEFEKLSDETAEKIVIELGKLDFVTDYKVATYEPVEEELSKARDS